MTMTNYEIIQKLAKKHNAEKEEFIRLLTSAERRILSFWAGLQGN